MATLTTLGLPQLPEVNLSPLRVTSGIPQPSRASLLQLPVYRLGTLKPSIII
jgi:hypothetical protein